MRAPLSPQTLKCTGRLVFPPAPVRRIIIELMKRIAHAAVSGIGEKPALLTEGGAFELLRS